MERLHKAVAVLTVALGIVWGQQPEQPGPNYDQGSNPEQTRPDQGVARLSLINGEVSVRRGDSGDVIAAALNAPLMVQDRVMTSSSSRAEIQFDAANVLRIASNSEVRIGDLQYGRAQIQLAIGTITLRVLRNSQSQIEIDLPSVGFRPDGPGVYRISVREDGTGDISVREGGGQVLTQGGAEALKAGSMMMVRGTGADAEYQVVNAPGVDDWDHWNQQRDGAFLQSRSAQYVSPDIYGTEDLDQNGRWLQDPSYGNVWAPNVQPGWAPYQAGQWVWEDYYGWTWVSTDPWGWAPYHYGRWFNGQAGWCWYPGAAYGHRYWSPALVGFFGFGGLRAGLGFGFGSIGWVALAPFEAIHPWWGRGYGREAIYNTTIVHNTNITNVYRNARVTNGVTGIGASDFGHRSGQFQRLSGSQVQGAGLVRGALPVAPSRSSLSFNSRPVSAARFPQTANRSFFGRPSATTSAQRTPFEQQQRTVQQATQRNFAAPANSPAARTSTGGGWERFNGASIGNRAAAPGTGWNSAPAARGGSQAPQSSYQAPRLSGGAGSQAARPSWGAGSQAPQSSYQAPRSSWGAGSQAARPSWGAGSQAVRISPPIVRSYSSGGSGYRGGSAPAYRAAPSSQSSGGGSTHSSGGGGHSSSGGGHSSGGGSTGGGGHHR